MRALMQRVSSASVAVEGETIGTIGRGLCIFVGITHADTEQSAIRLAERSWRLRVFEDGEGRANLSSADLDLELLVVSQFTLYADTSRGYRPSFLAAAPAEKAAPLVDRYVSCLRDLGARVVAGRFQAKMEIALVNDGPFTLSLEV